MHCKAQLFITFQAILSSTFTRHITTPFYQKYGTHSSCIPHPCPACTSSSGVEKAEHNKDGNSNQNRPEIRPGAIIFLCPLFKLWPTLSEHHAKINFIQQSIQQKFLTANTNEIK